MNLVKEQKGLFNYINKGSISIFSQENNPMNHYSLLNSLAYDGISVVNTYRAYTGWGYGNELFQDLRGAVGMGRNQR